MRARDYRKRLQIGGNKLRETNMSLDTSLDDCGTKQEKRSTQEDCKSENADLTLTYDEQHKSNKETDGRYEIANIKALLLLDVRQDSQRQ